MQHPYGRGVVQPGDVYPGDVELNPRAALADSDALSALLKVLSSFGRGRTLSATERVVLIGGMAMLEELQRLCREALDYEKADDDANVSAELASKEEPPTSARLAEIAKLKQKKIRPQQQ